MNYDEVVTHIPVMKTLTNGISLAHISIVASRLSGAIPKGDCLEYYTFGKDGYGDIQTRLDGKKIHLLAHRVAYMSKHQVILTKDEVVRHTCDNPKCVNPEHLILGTHADNVADRVARGRQAKGVANGRAKLTEKQVREIRISIGGSTIIGRKYGVNAAVIRGIRNKTIWRSVV